MNFSSDAMADFEGNTAQMSWCDGECIFCQMRIAEIEGLLEVNRDYLQATDTAEKGIASAADELCGSA